MSNSNSDKPVTLREAKKLISQRLRDPQTDPKTFRDLLVLLAKWSNWKCRRGPETAAAEPGADEVDDLVKRIEQEKRTPSVSNVVNMHAKQIAGGNDDGNIPSVS